MALSDIVNVLISSETTQVTRAGFGKALILSPHALFDDLVRTYSQPADMVLDGFATTSPEYKAASALFAQSPRPSSVKVGRRANKPTLRYTLTPVVANAKAYKIKLRGVEYSVTSDADATATEICDALRTALGSPSGITLGGTTTLTLTASAAGGWFDVEVDPATFASACDNADPGLAADLAAILLFDNDFYAVVSTHKSAAEIAAIAAWAEANGKLFCAASSNTDIIGSGSGDVATTLKTAAYARSWVLYHPAPGAFADAAIMGRCLPLDPGSETWKFKTLAGIPATKLTPAQRTNALGKNAMVYLTVGGVNITEEGKVAAGEFIDVIRFRDWVAARLQEDVFALLARSDKLPYTDAGGQGLASVVEGVLTEGVLAGGFSSDPGREPVVTVPLVADQPSADRLARKFGNVRWRAFLAGAVHSVQINGTISV